MINITSRAIVELNRIKQNQDTSAKYLQLKINKGGCLEYYYQLNFTEECTPENKKIPHPSGLTIITDEENYNHIENITIDYLEDLMGGAFQFKNPDIENHCNCGISFSITENKSGENI